MMTAVAGIDISSEEFRGIVLGEMELSALPYLMSCSARDGESRHAASVIVMQVFVFDVLGSRQNEFSFIPALC
jgi:hypothetical protein